MTGLCYLNRKCLSNADMIIKNFYFYLIFALCFQSLVSVFVHVKHNSFSRSNEITRRQDTMSKSKVLKALCNFQHARLRLVLMIAIIVLKVDLVLQATPQCPS